MAARHASAPATELEGSAIDGGRRAARSRVTAPPGGGCSSPRRTVGGIVGVTSAAASHERDVASGGVAFKAPAGAVTDDGSCPQAGNARSSTFDGASVTSSLRARCFIIAEAGVMG